ncbi:MAG: hypothetical protein H0X37_05375 [Herpetosiphonaceae bacterium]|nr:hypothetical protein [Herpetosiphonaceae bacterium]
MLDSRIVQLLEDAVNTSCKLALVLLYAEHSGFVVTPEQLALRLSRDPWSVDSAIRELARDGILDVCDGRIIYHPQPRWVAGLQELRIAYDDPYDRDTINHLARDLQNYAPYREELGLRQITVNAF